MKEEFLIFCCAIEFLKNLNVRLSSTRHDKQRLLIELRQTPAEVYSFNHIRQAGKNPYSFVPPTLRQAQCDYISNVD